MGVLEDVIMSFRDELSCQLLFTFVGVGMAACSENEDVSGTEGVGPCG